MAAQRSNDGLVQLVVIVLGVVVLIPLLMMAFAMPMMGWWWGDHMAGGIAPIWGIGMMLVWFLVLLGIGYLLSRGFVGGVRTSTVADPAIEELRIAYARGDLSEEEFEERRAKLQPDE